MQAQPEIPPIPISKIITVNLAYQTGGIWYNAIYFKRADKSLIRVIIEEQYNTKEEAISSWNIGIKTFPYGYMFIGEEITDTITEEITDYTMSNNTNLALGKQLV